MAIYRLSVKVGQQGAGRAHFDYITRNGKYSRHNNQVKEDLVYCASYNMPSWANTKPREFWKEEERHSDGFRKIELALPIELAAQDQIELVQQYCREEFGEEYSYTFAIHHSKGELSGKENPHAHIMFSERKIDRNREEPGRLDYFRKSRTRKDGSISGGYKKDRKFKGFDQIKEDKWIYKTREMWATLQKDALRIIGKGAEADKLSHKTLEEQGIDRVAQKHVGAKAVGMHKRGAASERMEEYLAFKQTPMAVRDTKVMHQEEASILQELAQLEREHTQRVRDYNQEKETLDQITIEKEHALKTKIMLEELNELNRKREEEARREAEEAQRKIQEREETARREAEEAQRKIQEREETARHQAVRSVEDYYLSCTELELYRVYHKHLRASGETERDAIDTINKLSKRTNEMFEDMKARIGNEDAYQAEKVAQHREYGKLFNALRAERALIQEGRSDADGELMAVRFYIMETSKDFRPQEMQRIEEVAVDHLMKTATPKDLERWKKKAVDSYRELIEKRERKLKYSQRQSKDQGQSR